MVMGNSKNLPLLILSFYSDREIHVFVVDVIQEEVGIETDEDAGVTVPELS